jgi:hypothetical protein
VITFELVTVAVPLPEISNDAPPDAFVIFNDPALVKYPDRGVTAVWALTPMTPITPRSPKTVRIFFIIVFAFSAFFAVKNSYWFAIVSFRIPLAYVITIFS